MIAAPRMNAKNLNTWNRWNSSMENDIVFAWRFSMKGHLYSIRPGLSTTATDIYSNKSTIEYRENQPVIPVCTCILQLGRVFLFFLSAVWSISKYSCSYLSGVGNNFISFFYTLFFGSLSLGRERLDRHLALKTAGQESGATHAFYNSMQLQGTVGEEAPLPSAGADETTPAWRSATHAPKAPE